MFVSSLLLSSPCPAFCLCLLSYLFRSFFLSMAVLLPPLQFWFAPFAILSFPCARYNLQLPWCALFVQFFLFTLPIFSFSPSLLVLPSSSFVILSCLLSDSFFFHSFILLLLLYPPMFLIYSWNKLCPIPFTIPAESSLELGKWGSDPGHWNLNCSQICF